MVSQVSQVSQESQKFQEFQESQESQVPQATQSLLVEMKGICKSFYGVEVLHAVDFDVKAGEVIALCGENGAGKSTLMKILSAVYDLDKGSVAIEGNPITTSNPAQMQRAGVSMIHQELNLLNDLTVAQNVFLSREPKIGVFGAVDFRKMNKDTEDLMKLLGENIKPTTKVHTLKIAQKQMVEIAKAISFDVKVIIMDEPTSVLTLKETEVLFRLIKSLTDRGIGIVYVTHRLGEVKQICDRVTILRDGYFVDTKRVSEISENQIASLMVGREVKHTVAEDFDGDENGVVLEVKNITGDILKDVSFKVRSGEILGFSGLIGAGRSELMEMIFGLRKFSQGEILLHGKAVTIKNAKAAISSNLGFATEDRKNTGLVLDRNIAENMDYVLRTKNKVGNVLSPMKVKVRAEDNIRRLRIVCSGPTQLAKNLSGGNQQKVVLAKWLSADPEIFIVDEPTRGIDVGARSEIYDIIKDLAASGKTIIVVSSDMIEVLSICHRVIVMHEGKITGEYTGDARTEENIMQSAVNVAAV